MFPTNSLITFHTNKEIFSLQWLTVDYRDLFTMATLMDNRLRSVLSLYSDVLVELHSKENPQKQHVRRTENGPTPCRSAGVSCFSSSVLHCCGLRYQLSRKNSGRDIFVPSV